MTPEQRRQLDEKIEQMQAAGEFPAGDSTPMKDSLIAWKELFDSAQAIGFTSSQALYLVACIATCGPGTAPST